MNLAFTRSFAKDLRQIRDASVLERLQEVIQEIETAGSIQDLKNLKKLSPESRHYRLRLGDYRLGLVIEADTVTLVRILHRKDIYRYFP
ncbi:MAG: type II toxin-antitoxin system RelE/ParE family toxin [Thermodesulfobacteriota bacterium]